jgi:hypothetical protein
LTGKCQVRFHGIVGKSCLPFARRQIDNLAGRMNTDALQAVSEVVEAKDDQWRYQEPVTEKPVHSIGIGIDGTMMLLCEDGYREAMVGTIALG